MADKIYSFRIDIEDRGRVAEEINRVDQELKELNVTRRENDKLLKQGKITQEQYDKALKQNTISTSNLRQQKLALNKADRSLAKQTISTKGSMEQLRQETSRLIQTANQLNLTTAQGRKRFAEIQKQVDRNKTSIRNFDRQMSGSKTLVGEYGRGILTSFKSMAAGFVGVTALIKGVRDIVKVTGDFDTATAKLAAVTGSTREEIAELTKTAKQLGSVSIFTASQVTDLQVSLAKLGFTTSEIQDSTEAVVQFATAVGSDLGGTAKVTGVAVRAFGLDTLEAADAAATLAVATTKSALAFEDYETILSTVGPVAKSYGFTLEDTVALTGRLRDAGFDASKAATATRNILLNLADANGALAQKLGGNVKTFPDLIDAMKRLDEQGIGLAETLELTDKRSVAAFNQFLSAADSTKTLRDEITDVNDELQEMVETQLDSFAGDVKSLQSAWEGLILAMQGTGVIRGAIQGLKDGILQVQNLDLAVRKFNKQSGDQLERSFDLLNNLSNKQGQQFREVVEYLDGLTDEEIWGLDQDVIAQKFEAVRKVNDKEAVALFQEYQRRRDEQGYQEIIKERTIAERKAEDAIAQEKKAQAELESEQVKAAEKRAKEVAKAEKKAKEEEAKEAERLEKERLREIEQYQKKTSSEIQKAYSDSQKQLTDSVDDNADIRIQIMEQELAAINAAIATNADEEIAVREQLLERRLAKEEEIRMAAFDQEKIARGRSLEEVRADYEALAATLENLKSRLAAGDITQEYFDVQKETIEAAQENLSAAQVEIEEQQRQSAEVLENDLTDIKRKGANDRTQIEIDAQKKTLDAINQGLQIASDLTSSFGQLFEAQKQRELSAVGDNAKKREEIERKYASRQQAISVVQAIINVAQGITKAIAQGGILGLITGAVVAAAGAAQISVIRSQAFAEGGAVQTGSELPGLPKSGDNTLALVKPGEVILNQAQQARLGGAAMFKRIGVPGFASGGVVGSPEPDVSNLSQTANLGKMIRGLKVTLNVNELHDAEDELEVINETSEL